MTPIERLQTSLTSLGLKAVEARLENLLEQAAKKTPGYAEQILRNFAFGPKDVLIVISTSGIREVIIEIAVGAKQRGLAVIGVLSRAHCEQSRPAHVSGRKLIDVADVILDNGAPTGDSLLTLETPGGGGYGRPG